MRALLYTRVSIDRAQGRSPAEQEAESRALCQREGWEVLEVVTETGSASRYSKSKRPGWRRVHALLAEGKVDVLVTWEASRAQRDLAAYAELRDLCVEHGVLWSYSGVTHDMATSDDRFKTGLDALLAEREVDLTRDRILRAVRSNAAAGRPHGRRLFGYRRVYDPTTGALDGQEIDPAEAEVIRGMFAGYLAGQGIRTMLAELTARDVRTGTGGLWSDYQIRRALRNPHYVARRVHRGQVVGPGDWPAIVDDDTFERVQAKLDDSGARHVRVKWTARLLSGVGRCGVCGGKVSAIHDRNKRKVYACRVGFCVSRDLKKLDAYVVARLLEHLANADVEAVEPVSEARGKLTELTGRLDEAVAECTAGRLSASSLAKIEAGLIPLIRDAEREVRRSYTPGVDIGDAGPQAWWDAMTSEQQRDAVNILVAAVVILPTVQGGRTFRPDAVRIEFRR